MSKERMSQKTIDGIKAELKAHAMANRSFEKSEDERAWNHYLSIKDKALNDVVAQSQYIPELDAYWIKGPQRSPIAYEFGLFLKEGGFLGMFKEEIPSHQMKEAIVDDFNKYLRTHKIHISIRAYPYPPSSM